MLDASMALRGACSHQCVEFVDEQNDLPLASVISFKRLSAGLQNSPRNFAPATNAARSKATRRLVFNTSGTSRKRFVAPKPSTSRFFPTQARDQQRVVFSCARAKSASTANFFVTYDYGVEL